MGKRAPRNRIPHVHPLGGNPHQFGDFWCSRVTESRCSDESTRQSRQSRTTSHQGNDNRSPGEPGVCVRLAHSSATVATCTSVSKRRIERQMRTSPDGGRFGRRIPGLPDTESICRFSIARCFGPTGPSARLRQCSTAPGAITNRGHGPCAGVDYRRCCDRYRNGRPQPPRLNGSRWQCFVNR